MDEILAVDDGSAIEWSLADHEGSIRDILDDTGSLAEHRDYTAYGEMSRFNPDGTPDTTALDFIFAFTGREWDNDIHLANHRARWYDPHAARFINQDPSGFAGGDANLYRYAGNNPVMYVDPSGLCPRGYDADAAYADWFISSYAGSNWNPNAGSGSWNSPVTPAATSPTRGAEPPLEPVGNWFTRTYAKVGNWASQTYAFSATLPGAVASSFSDGRAWDSAQGAMVEMADSGADLFVAGVNSTGHGAAWVKSAATGRRYEWDDVERAGRLSDYVSPLYGNWQEMQQGQVVGHYTVRAQALVAAAWEITEAIVSLPAMGSAIFDAGATWGGGLTVSNGGLMLTSSAVGGTSTVAGTGLAIGSAAVAVYESGALDPLYDWMLMSPPSSDPLHSSGKSVKSGGSVADDTAFGLTRTERTHLVKKRPQRFRKGVVDDVWENAKGPDGKVRDPNTGEELFWDRTKNRNGQWDMGHKPGKSYDQLKQRFLDGEISRKQFLDEYHNPGNYRPEANGTVKRKSF